MMPTENEDGKDIISVSIDLCMEVCLFDYWRDACCWWDLSPFHILTVLAWLFDDFNLYAFFFGYHLVSRTRCLTNPYLADRKPTIGVLGWVGGGGELACPTKRGLHSQGSNPRLRLKMEEPLHSTATIIGGYAFHVFYLVIWNFRFVNLLWSQVSGFFLWVIYRKIKEVANLGFWWEVIASGCSILDISKQV